MSVINPGSPEKEEAKSMSDDAKKPDLKIVSEE